ncbi:MAG: tRNA (adenosine(37)-N6)-threonylcarbamoyltransferase complex ATPase subunit type 1 TsaE [Candidatus Omnitrophica bacterium]|nr:tRNA (adenosine(37)-N6)-threonylcarbamoyltransferase complex ATPase subunit type 1 TsaE [Candidatus Omnitrophota bacterium]
MKKSVRFSSHSPAQTKKIGERIGALLKGGDALALVGELGAGKTTFAKGVAKALGVPGAAKTVVSPTFTLIHEYEGREKIYHLDWYRLDAVRGEDAFLTEDCFGSGAVCLVEWAGRGRALFPENYIEVRFRHAGLSSRKIEIFTRGARYADFLKKI